MERVREHGYALVLAAILTVIGLLTARWAIEEYDGLGDNIGIRSGVSSRQPSTEQLIASLQGRLQAQPDDDRAYAQLGNAYLQQTRETGDPSYYGKAEAVFAEALAIQPESFEAMIGMGSLALSRHDFQQALAWGERARAINPYSAPALGVIADAQIELGRYEDAATTLQLMANLRPDFGTYVRISYWRELNGDTEGAIAALKLAASAGTGFQENAAWLRVQLGNLYFGRGDLEAAEREYRLAMELRPGYAHGLAALGRVEAARGDYAKAIALYKEATEKMPAPEYIGALGDVYNAAGQTREGARQFELVEAIQRLYQASGVNTDLEMAVFFADHNINLDEALWQARLEYERRPSIQAADILAWTLYKLGQYEEARRYSEEATRLGTKDATILFHAGMIRERLWDYEKAKDYLERAIELNPRFSTLHADIATKTLERLRSHVGR